MAKEYELSFTAEEIDEMLGKAGAAVTFTKQELTPAQQAQVRDNIGINVSGGATPVKGVDYFTEEDKSEFVAAVIAALPDASEVEY